MRKQIAFLFLLLIAIPGPVSIAATIELHVQAAAQGVHDLHAAIDRFSIIKFCEISKYTREKFVTPRES